MENIENEEGLSFGELCHIIFSRKWLLLIITGIITLLGTLGIVLVFNNSKETYTTNFTIVFPSKDTIYPDGTRFNYLDLISYENLEEVKTSDDSFKNINIKAMYESNNISITDYSDNAVETNKYSISVKSKYFSSQAQAKKFMIALTNQPIEYIVNTVKTSGYKANLEVFNNAITYESQINALINQQEYLITNYNKLIDNNFSLYIVDGKTILEYLNEVTLFFKENDIKSLTTELELNGYVKSESTKETYELKIEALTEEKRNNNNTIKNLQEKITQLKDLYDTASLIPTFESFNKEIAELTVRNSEIDVEVEKLNKYITGSSNSSFEGKLLTYYNKIKEFTDNYHKAEISVYERNSKVNYHSGSIIETSGTINIVIAAALSLVVGLAVGSAVILVMDLPKYKKRKEESLDDSKEINK